MGFPFPDNDDHLGQYDDPDPEECCRHNVPVSEPCDACAEAAYERFVERFQSSEGPVTVQERYRAAANEKRRIG